MFSPSPGLRVINHPAASRHPSAEGNLDRNGMRVSSPIRRKGELTPQRGGGIGASVLWVCCQKMGAGVFVFLSLQCKSTNRQLITIDKLSSNGLEWRMYWCQFPMLMFCIVIRNGLSHLPHLGCNNWSGT